MRARYIIPLMLLCAMMVGFARPVAADESQVIALIDLLGEKSDAGERRYAADGLADFGPAARDAVDPLIASLGSSDTELIWRCLRALGSIGPDASKAVKPVAEKLTHPNPIVRAHAAHALEQIGEASNAALNELIKAITDTDARVRREAIEAVTAISPGKDVVLPILIKVLEDSDPSVVFPAMQTITEVGKPAVPNLVKALENEKAQYWAVIILSTLGPEGADAVPALTKLLKSDEPEMVMQVALALGKIGSASASASDELVELIKHKEVAVQTAAVYALGLIGAKDAAGAIEEAGKSKDALLSMVSVWAIAKLHPDDKDKTQKAIDAIVRNLRSRDQTLRNAAATGLVELKAPSEMVRPVLINVLETADQSVINSVLDAIAAQGETVVPKVADALKVEKLKTSAARVLQMIGPDAASAVDAIAAELDSTGETVFQEDLLLALASIGKDSKSAVGKVIPMLASEEGQIRTYACYVLGTIGPDAKEAGDVLKDIVEKEDLFSQITAAWALAKIYPTDNKVLKAAIPLLTRALQVADREGKIEAAIALGDMGSMAQSSVPALRRLVSSTRDRTVREYASDALKKISQ